MRTFVVTVNGVSYQVSVEEVAQGAVPAAAPAAPAVPAAPIAPAAPAAPTEAELLTKLCALMEENNNLLKKD